jgi:hypothetical protein
MTAVSVSDWTVSSGRTIYELGSIYGVAVTDKSRFYRDICVKGTKDITKTLSQESQKIRPVSKELLKHVR